MTGLLVSLLLVGAAVTLEAPSVRLQHTGPSSARAGNVRGIGEAPLILDLLGALLTAGASVERALSIVSESCETGIGSSLQRVCAARLLGASWEAAWDVAVEHRSPSGQRPGRRDRRASGHQERSVAEVRQGLHFATSTGAPSAALLHAHAAQLRRRHNREIDRRAAALGVQLVLPLGLCSLPAFICLGVVPVVLGLLPEL